MEIILLIYHRYQNLHVKIRPLWDGNFNKLSEYEKQYVVKNQTIVGWKQYFVCEWVDRYAILVKIRPLWDGNLLY